MNKKSKIFKYKRYSKGLIIRNLTISFIGGITAGLTVWFFGRIMPYLREKEYVIFAIGFGMYVFLGIILYILLKGSVLMIFGKPERSSKDLKKRK
tara:strand:- start:76 stop:360 length:285 start_codon:yes stop_codon:yes gene_type:complete